VPHQAHRRRPCRSTPGHGNTTGSPPRLLTGRAEHRRPRGLHRAGAVSTLDAYYAAAPASTLLLRRNRERRGGLPNPRLHTEVHTNDSNNGTRARLPLCNPNPNRVKAKRKRDRGGGHHCLPVTPVTTTTAVGGGRGEKMPQRSTAHGKEKVYSRVIPTLTLIG